MKLYRNIIIFVVAIAVLVGAFIGVYFLIPENEEKPIEETSETEIVSVMEVDSASITKIDIKTKEEEYSVTKSGDKWHLSNEEGLKISDSKLQSFSYMCSSISATKIMSEKAEDAEKFGFSDTSNSVTIHLSDGSKKTVLVGDTTLDDANSYIKLSDENTIYLKSTYGVSSLIPEYKSFVDKSLLSIDLSNLSLLTHVYIEKEGNTPIKLEYTEKGNSNEWKMISPVYSAVNGQVLSDDILTPLAEYTATEIAEIHVKNLAPYGLDTPYATFSIGYDGKTSELVFGDEYDKYRFVMVSGFDTVYMIKSSQADFLDTPYQNLMSRLIHVEYIDQVSKVEIKSGTTNIVMEIGDDIYKINGKEIEKSKFSKAYQAVIGISLDSVDLSSVPAGAYDATIKYTKTDGSTVTVGFIPVSERNYRAVVDGKGNCITAKKNFTEAVEFILNNAK